MADYRIESFLRLPEDWDSYGSNAINVSEATRAIELLVDFFARGAPAPWVGPATRGGILIEWSTRGIDLELQVLPSGRLEGAFTDEESGDEWELDLSVDRGPLSKALAALTSRV